MVISGRITYLNHEDNQIFTLNEHNGLLIRYEMFCLKDSRDYEGNIQNGTDANNESMIYKATSGMEMSSYLFQGIILLLLPTMTLDRFGEKSEYSYGKNNL